MSFATKVETVVIGIVINTKNTADLSQLEALYRKVNDMIEEKDGRYFIKGSNPPVLVRTFTAATHDSIKSTAQMKAGSDEDGILMLEASAGRLVHSKDRSEKALISDIYRLAHGVGATKVSVINWSYNFKNSDKDYSQWEDAK